LTARRPGLPPSAERALGLAAALAAGCALAIAPASAERAAIAAAEFLPGLWLLARSSRRPAQGLPAAVRRAALPVLFAAAAGAAAALAASRLDPAPALLGRLAQRGFEPGHTPVRIIATLLDRETIAPDRIALVVRLERLVCPAGAPGEGEPGRGVRARITVPPPDPGSAPWKPGDRLELTARLGPPRAYGNPGAFDLAAYYDSLGIALTGSCKSARLVLPRGEDPALLHFGARARLSLIEALRTSAGSEPPGTAAFLEALLLGERQAIAPEDEETLKRSGVYHILALSGFNVALIAAAAGGVLLLLPLPPRARRPAVLAVVVLYAAIARPSGSIARAVLMALLCGAGTLLGRRVAPAGALGVSAMLLLLFRPAWIADPGFQLSYAATLGLLLDPGSGAVLPPPRGILARARRTLRSAVRASGAALLATAPFTARHFQSLTAAGLVANLAAVPLSSLLLLLAACAAPLGLLHPAAAAPLMTIATPLIAALRWSAVTCASIPLGSLPVQPPSWRVVAAASLLTLGLALARPRTVRIACACLLAITASGIILRGRIVRPDGRLQIVVLDVGQGDSILVRLPRGGAVLVDAGGRPGDDFDVGARVVAPALRALGVLKLDLLVVTHPHRDHLGGAASILRAFRPEAVWLGDSSRGDRRYAEVEEAAAAAGAAILRPRRGVDLVWQGVSFNVLNPPGARTRPGAVGNDDSLALRLVWGGQAALLPGDLEHAAEETIAAGRTSLDAAFLKVAHHGSATSTSPAFLAAVHPRTAVVSAGAGNPWGHPSPEVMERLRHIGCRVFVTMRDGAVRARTDGRTPFRVERLTSVPDEAEDLRGLRDEREDENDEPQNGDRPPPRTQRSQVVDRARVPRAEKSEQDPEEHQVEPSDLVSPDDQDEGQDPRHPEVRPRRQRVHHVPAVELPDRQEIERRREQAEPGGIDQRMQLDRLPRLEMEEQGVGEIQEKARSQRHIAGGGGSTGDDRVSEPVPENRQQRREAGERTGDPDVEKSPPVGERRADADDGAEGSEQVRSRQEERQRRIDPVVTTGDVMPHLVRAEDANRRERVGKAGQPGGRGTEDLEERRRTQGIGPCEDRSRDGRTEESGCEADAIDPRRERTSRPPSRRRGNLRRRRPGRVQTERLQTT
jgi:competence protein ComEC